MTPYFPYGYRQRGLGLDPVQAARLQARLLKLQRDAERGPNLLGWAVTFALCALAWWGALRVVEWWAR